MDKRGEQSRSDVVVIGGGIGGLASALALTRAEKQVVVLEAAPRLGGRGASDFESGFVINQGPHALYEGSRSILASLGVEVGARLVSPRDTYVDDGETLHTLPGGAAAFFTTTYLDARDRLALGRVLPLLLASGPNRAVTFAAWLDRQDLPRRVRALIEMIGRVATYGAAPEHAAAAPILAQMRSAIIGGVRYVDGGWNAIVEALARGLGQTGRAQVVRRTRALCIEPVRDGFAVRLEGRVLECRDVIIAGPTGLAASLLAPLGAHEPPSGPPLRVACLDLGLARLPAGSVKSAFGTTEPTYVAVHSQTAVVAPAGQAMVHAALYLASRKPDPVPDRALIERALDRAIPGWRAEVRFERYSPAALASSAEVDAPLGFAGRPSVTVAGLSDKHRGVHRVGDWIGARGLLLDGVLASAIEAARACDRGSRGAVASSAHA